MHIWMNLLDNAIKFSPENGTITMFLRHENDSVQFILEDEDRESRMMQKPEYLTSFIRWMVHIKPRETALVWHL